MSFLGIPTQVSGVFIWDGSKITTIQLNDAVLEIKLTGSLVDDSTTSLNFIGNNFNITGSSGILDVLSKDQFSYKTIATNKTVTIHENQQMLYEGDLSVDGDLIVDGEVVQIVGDVEIIRVTDTVSSSITSSVGKLFRLDPTDGPFDIALPDNPKIDAEIGFKNITTNTSSIIINGNGNNIDGQSTFTMDTERQWLKVHYDGFEWLIIN